MHGLDEFRVQVLESNLRGLFVLVAKLLDKGLSFTTPDERFILVIENDGKIFAKRYLLQWNLKTCISDLDWTLNLVNILSPNVQFAAAG